MYPCSNDKECSVGSYCHSPHHSPSRCLNCRRRKKRCNRDAMCCPGNRCSNCTSLTHQRDYTTQAFMQATLQQSTTGKLNVSSYADTTEKVTCSKFPNSAAECSLEKHRVQTGSWDATSLYQTDAQRLGFSQVVVWINEQKRFKAAVKVLFDLSDPPIRETCLNNCRLCSYKALFSNQSHRPLTYWCD